MKSLKSKHEGLKIKVKDNSRQYSMFKKDSLFEFHYFS